MGEDELLDRVGHVEPVVAGEPGGRHHLADRGGRHPQLVDVEDPVQVAETERVGLVFVQRRGQRGADTGADQANEIAGAVER
jgi:hypothetical protein